MFSWVAPDKLAGMSRPGIGLNFGEMTEDQEMLELRRRGINMLIQLTERPINTAKLRSYGFNFAHIPIPDFGIPTDQQVEQFVSVVDEAFQRGDRVAVFCAAGLGRTGTMLALYEVAKGAEPRHAIEHIRRLRPGSIETDEQEECVHEYALRHHG